MRKFSGIMLMVSSIMAIAMGYFNMDAIAAWFPVIQIATFFIAVCLYIFLIVLSLILTFLKRNEWNKISI